jgi:plastocyanin
MGKGLIIIVIAIFVIFFGLFGLALFLSSDSDVGVNGNPDPDPDPNSNSDPDPVPDDGGDDNPGDNGSGGGVPDDSVPPSLHVVNIASQGFSPGTLEVNAGDIITWINADIDAHWIRSDDYPGADPAKCGEPEKLDILDSCREIEPSESYPFIINEVGEWSYYDVLNPNSQGTVIVH